MSFGRPDLLWLALALPAVVAAAVFGYVHRRRRVARALGEADLVRRLGAGDLARFPVHRLALLSVAAAALGLAAAGPQWGTRTVETESRALHAVLAMDVSRSMLARDVAPDRLERARLLASRLLRELRGDRIGLVVFAGRAYILSPLTTDHGALQLYVDALDPEVVSQGGSSLASAINQATDLARGHRTSRGDRIVILMTDGEALEEEGGVLQAADRAAAAGITVHAIGIGTGGGAPVPEVDPRNGQVVGYKRDPMGEVVISRRNDRLLEGIADATGGRYVRAEQAGGTDRLLAALKGAERASSRAGRSVQAREQFAWFVALALALLAADAVLERRSGARRRRTEDETMDIVLQEAPR